jgi:hypothetical protein
MNRRPSGVTLSAVVLGIFDIFLLIAGLIYVMIAFVFARSPGLPAASVPNGAPPPQQLVVGMMAFFALFALLCAAWGISTFVGLLRMRNWARISIMIIGGCLAALSLFELFFCILVQIMIKTGGLPQNANSANLAAANPAALQVFFLIGDAMCVAVAAIGIWWIVYFAKQKTRAAFESVALQPALSSTAQLNPATPITDFSVAQPVEPAQPVPVQHVVPVPAPEAIPEAPTRPISMTIVAVLCFLGCASLALCCLLPYPQFFFGVQVSEASKYVLLIAMSVFYALAGFGLLRRMYFGWLLAVGMNLLGLLNMLTFLSPSVRERYMAFMQTLSQSAAPPMPSAAQASAQIFQQQLMAQMMFPVFAVCGLFILFILALLWRARWWYKSTE